jgi:hypothetical protein
MTQITLPDQTIEKLNRSAAEQGIEPAQLLVRLVEEYLAGELRTQPEFTEQEKKINWEQQQYEAQHSDLLHRFKGEYIAMHEGKVVDHDQDAVALGRRIRKLYGKIAVLITRVGEEPMLTITVRSPRLVRE